MLRVCRIRLLSSPDCAKTHRCTDRRHRDGPARWDGLELSESGCPVRPQCLPTPIRCGQPVGSPGPDSGVSTVEITSGVAIWYTGGKPLVPMRWVIVRDPTGRVGARALLCTDTEAEPLRILQWYKLRWQVEVTFEELRAHMGVETQRQWSDRAIARTAPALFGLFSLVTLAAMC